MSKKVNAGIELFGDRLLVEIIKPDDKSKGGVLLPGSVREGSFKKAHVRIVGQGTALEDGKFAPPIVRAGDQILLPASAGVAVELAGEKYHMVRESDVIGILK